MKLFCMRVGATADPFSVEAQPHDTIEKLKELVIAKTKLKKKHSPQDIKLFLAKRDGQWLSADSEEVKALQRGDVEAIFDLLDTALNPMKEVLEVFQDVQERVLHVLVVQPAIAKMLPSPSAMLHSKVRRKRWRQLNGILDTNKRAKATKDFLSTRYSYTTWTAVESYLQSSRYDQERMVIGDMHTDFLYKYIAEYASYAMNGCEDAPHEAKRYHFIAPLLIMVCRLFDDVKLFIEQSVDGGEDLHAHGEFEFVFKRDKKTICIVEVKKHDIDQGKAHVLLGCQAASAESGRHVVYGITTDFSKWEIYQCGEYSILRDSFCIDQTGGIPSKEGVVRVCEKIYALLSNHSRENEEERRLAQDVGR